MSSMFGNASIGFSRLPGLSQRKTFRKGFQFTMMVVGEAGLGKSTLINSLFLTEMYPERTMSSLTDRVKTKTIVSIEPATVEIEEDGVKVKLTIIDTPGFGDGLDDSGSVQFITNYIDEQFEKYYKGENSLHRRLLIDNRVHACLYFISPFGHGLKPIDTKFLSEIHGKVNLIPVIAKADALTKNELSILRSRILDELSKHKIKFYQPEEFDFQMEDRANGDKVKIGSVVIPFAVSGANTVVSVGDDKVRGLLYPWGFLDVENSKLCDLSVLRQFIIRNMQDMLDETHEVFYEEYRLERMAKN